MSVDKPAGGGHRPDQDLKPEHRPFPGQPENRPHVPRPEGTKTPEQMRAERAQYKTTSEYLAAKAAEKTIVQRAANDSTSGAGTPGTPGAPGPGTRDRAGAVPGRTPGRGDTAGQHPPGTQDRAPASSPDTPGTRGPDRLTLPDRTHRRPFPGQSEDRPRVPRPEGTKTPEQMRADRKQYTTTSEYMQAKAAEKPAHQAVKESARAKQAAAPKETPAGKPGTGATAERGTSTRDQSRTGGSEQEREGPARAREASTPADRTSAAQAARHGNHPDTAAQPGNTASARPDARQGATATDGHHPPGNENSPRRPDASRTQLSGAGGILHGHSEFHGQKIDLYSDGTRWVSGDAVRAAQAGKEHKQETPRHDISSIPGMRDQGRAIIGERPDDEADLPPDREELLEGDDRRRSRAERLFDKVEGPEVLNDAHDAVQEQSNNFQEVLGNWQPQGHTVQSVPGPAYGPAPVQGHGQAGDMAAAGLMIGIAIFDGGRRIHDMVTHSRKADQ